MDMGARWAMITGMGTAMADADLLRLMQWLSPAFPVGGYAYSHGLEQGVAAGDVTSPESLCAWLTEILARGAGLADGVLLGAARAGRDDAADWARALAPSRERWIETRDQGTAFALAVAAVGVSVPAGLALPVAVGIAARTLDLPDERVIALYLQSFAANLVSVAVRFVPLGQAAGQRVLAALHPTILSAATQATRLTPETNVSAVPGADLAAMRHETMEVRLFRS